jgi:hypothetical protein
MKEKSLPKLQEAAQKVFNKWVRQRDEGEPCISCGSFKANQAGHYFSQKCFSIVRYDETNVNLQCASCNLFKHGNGPEYRIGLVRKYGEDAVKELEERAMRKVHKFTRSELEEIIKKYQ